MLTVSGFGMLLSVNHHAVLFRTLSFFNLPLVVHTAAAAAAAAAAACGHAAACFFR